MAYIKRVTMKGFKSFAKKTDIWFDKGINVILGPNGSGKSNISDALCFVLGRLSIKSIRAAKAKNLLFMGTKVARPAKEAYVELAFDNSDRTFNVNQEEVVLKRIVRHNGQSIYKINDQTKTRGEVIELLAHAGIDPHGFNLILQGQIQSIVKMHSHDRRKIIEEVAGISIYESRKEKSLKELDKSEDKLKQIAIILRERTAYLRNLENEKSQALRYKQLEETVKRCKATILNRKSEGKGKEVASVVKSIEEKMSQKDKIKVGGEGMQSEIESLSSKIQDINKKIQEATGIEQDNLHNEIANLKAELEGMRVRKESYENRRGEVERRIEELNKNIPEMEEEIGDLRKQAPGMAKKAETLQKKKEELAALESEKKIMLGAKSELNSLRERVKDKRDQLSRAKAEGDALLKQVDEFSENLRHNNEKACLLSIENLRKELDGQKGGLDSLGIRELENEKIVSIAESEIERAEKIKGDVDNIDTCPLCQSEMTKDHKDHVFSDCDSKILEAKGKLEESQGELEKIKSGKEKLLSEIGGFESKIRESEGEIAKHGAINDKREQIRKFISQEKILKEEIDALEERRKNLESKSSDLGKVEERYDSKILEIEEISARTEEDVDNTILYKQRELESIKNIIKRSTGDLEDIDIEIGEISEGLESKENDLVMQEEQEKALNQRFKKMFETRDSMQREIQEKSLELTEVQSDVRQIEDQVNYLKIGKAKLDAEKEALEMDIAEFENVPFINGSLAYLEERLRKSQENLSRIGSINMRALEVYDEVKKEYDIVAEKVEILNKEKGDILNIIAEIDRKKKREFMKVFRGVNELFMNNFAKLYTKGTAYLEVENKQDIFAGGIDIVVKLSKGKYFDVSSLSGGEQTLVALSLLFAIQEFKPYHFYIFDEIDAALDKRNSERLAGLLNQYMKTGQYIVITHNDAIITNSNLLYGVSMHEGVSKILSLKLD